MTSSATTILARIAGPYLVVIGAAMALRGEAFIVSIGNLLSLPATTLLVGLFTLLVGLIVVVFHNRWSGLAQIVISLLGWASVVRGVALLIIPDVVRTLFANVAHWPIPVLASILCIALGLYLSCVGYLSKEKQ